jgi:hypothetical protein
MVLLVDKVVQVGGVGDPEELVGFEVWFNTPWGLFKNLDRAIQECETNGLDPELSIKPTGVAIGSGGGYETI